MVDDFSGTTGTTGAINVGGTANGAIETAGDTDWFKITLTGGKTYQFDLEGSATGQGTLSDPFLRLRDSAGNPVTNAFADDGGAGFNSRFSFAIANGGTYFLAAGSSTASGTGSYKMSVTDVTPSPPSDDFSGTTGTTGAINVGGTANGAIETAGDTDWFKITLTGGKTYQFDLEGSATGQGTLSDPFLRLRDSAGNPVTNAFADDGGAGFNSRFSFAIANGGTYFLAAGSSTASGTGSYKMSVTDVTPSPPSDDFSGTTGTTGAINVGGTANGAIETAGDTDWFKITLTGGKTYQFDLEGSATGQGTLSDPFLRLRDSAGNPVTNAFADDGGAGFNSRFSFAIANGGTYFLAAGSSTASGTGSYKMSVTDVTPSPPSDDFSGTTGTTGAINVGGTANGAIETAGDTDWFKITLTGGKTYQFDLEGSATGQGTLSDPFLRLRDSAGNPVTNAFADDGGAGFNSRFSFAIANGGTYFLAAGSSTASGTGSYKMSVTDVTPSPPSDDFSGTTGTTGAINVGGTANGAIETAGDTDWFKITLTGGKTYQFDLEGSATGQGTLSDPFLRLRDSAGNPVTNAFADDGGAGFNSRFSFAIANGGTYFLAAGSSTASGTGSYKMSVTDVTPPIGDDFPNNTSTTGTLSPGSNATGVLETAGDTDWFKIALQSGQTYRFDLEGSPNGQGTLSDTFLRLRDVNGNTIANAFADDGGTGLNSRFTYSPSSTGSYILAAGAGNHNPNATGSYKMSVTDVTPTAGDAIGKTAATAGSLSPETTLPGTIEQYDRDGSGIDADYFQVTLQGGHRYKFSADARVSMSDTLDQVFLRLRDLGGNELSPNKFNEGATPSFIYDVPGSGERTYYLSISGGGSGVWQDKTGAYTVSVADLGIQPTSDAVQFDFPLGDPDQSGHRLARTRADDSDGYHVTSYFGFHDPDVSTSNRDYHLGEDWNQDGSANADLDDPVYAIADGTVVYARDGGIGWGDVVILKHLLPNGEYGGFVTSLYGHLTDLQVTAGPILRGDLIGYIGAHPNGPHLHFEIRAGTNTGALTPGNAYSTTPRPVGWLNPTDFIGFRQGVTLSQSSDVTVSSQGDQLQTLVGAADQHLLTVSGRLNIENKLSVAAQGQSVVVSHTDTADVVLQATQFTELAINGVDDKEAWNIGPLSGTHIAQSTIFFDGAGGDDLLDASAADKRIVADGGLGNDTLITGAADDALNGGLGADTLDGGGGFDTADYSDKTASLYVALNGAINSFVKVGGVNEDTIRNIENVTGGSGADSMTGDAFANLLAGGGGNDTLRGGGGNDVIDGGGGNDAADFRDKTTGLYVVLNGALDSVVKVGGIDEDTIRNVEIVYGGSGADSLTGDGLANFLLGGGGNDTLRGGGGNDVIDGGGGGDAADFRDKTAGLYVVLKGASDSIVKIGGVNEDTIRNVESIYGGSGADSMTGDGLANFFLGGGGNDVMRGGGGNDVIDGGGGGDAADFRDKTAAVSVTLNGAVNTTAKVGGLAEDTVRNVESVYGGSVGDILIGDGFANLFLGGGGDDRLAGMLGNDVLDGGLGADKFVFNTAPGAANIDTILNYDPANDTIELANAIFTGLAAGTLASGAFNTGAAATQTDDRIIYNNATGALLFDADGVGGAAGVRFATLTTGLALSNADFVLV